MVMSDEILGAVINSVATLIAALIGVAAVYVIRNPPAPKRSDTKTDAFVDQIVSMAKSGDLRLPLSSAVLVRAFPERKESYLRSLLANYCHPTGNYVVQGQRARFRRVAKGKYLPL